MQKSKRITALTRTVQAEQFALIINQQESLKQNTFSIAS